MITLQDPTLKQFQNTRVYTDQTIEEITFMKIINNNNNNNMVYTLVGLSGKKIFPIKSVTHHQHIYI